MAEISLNVAKREPSTKGTLNQLRRDGYVPGTYYIHGQDPISFTVAVGEVNPLVYTSDNHIINFAVEDKEISQAILKDIQFDPVSEKIMHIDLLGLTKGQEVDILVPVIHTGYSKGVKSGGILNANLLKLEVRCLPRHIPEHITIDITDLAVGDAVRVRDLSYENITITSPPNLTVVAVSHARAVEEEVEDVAADAEEASAEPEVISKGSSDDEE